MLLLWEKTKPIESWNKVTALAISHTHMIIFYFQFSILPWQILLEDIKNNTKKIQPPVEHREQNNISLSQWLPGQDHEFLSSGGCSGSLSRQSIQRWWCCGWTKCLPRPLEETQTFYNVAKPKKDFLVVLQQSSMWHIDETQRKWCGFLVFSDAVLESPCTGLTCHGS